MKKAIFIALALLFLSARAVNAQVPTPQTPTPIPAPTPTPTPAGWSPRPSWLRPDCFWPGQEIRLADWYKYCYRYCYMPQPFPTPTGLPNLVVPTLVVSTPIVHHPFPTATPLPTVAPPTPTPPPHPTATPSPTPTPRFVELRGWYKVNSGDPEEMQQPEDIFIDSLYLKINRVSSYNPGSYSYGVLLAPQDITVCDANGNLKVSSVVMAIDWNRIFEYDYYSYVCSSGRDGLGCEYSGGSAIKADSNVTLCRNNSADKCASCHIDQFQVHVTIRSTTNDDVNYGLRFLTRGLMAYNQKRDIVSSKAFDYLPNPQPTPTPAPTPTLTPTPLPAGVPAFCFAGWYEENPAPERTPWDDIEFSDGGCYTIVPGGTVGEWFTIPGFEVCVTNVSFPPLQAFLPFIPSFISVWALIAMIPASALLYWILKQWGG